MGSILILAFIVLVGPLAIVYGADSRRFTDRGWFGTPPAPAPPE